MPFSAIASGLASFFNYNQNKRINEANRASQEAANAANLTAQKEFAQNSILWRRNDARNAGINPIYALSANGASFTPSFTSSTFRPYDVEAPNLKFLNRETEEERLQKDLLRAQIKNINSQSEANMAKSAALQTRANGDGLNSQIDRPDLQYSKNGLNQYGREPRQDHFFAQSKNGNWNFNDFGNNEVVGIPNLGTLKERFSDGGNYIMLYKMIGNNNAEEISKLKNKKYYYDFFSSVGNGLPTYVPAGEGSQSIGNEINSQLYKFDKFLKSVDNKFRDKLYQIWLVNPKHFTHLGKAVESKIGSIFKRNIQKSGSGYSRIPNPLPYSR